MCDPSGQLPRQFDVAVVPGDGIGPEVCDAAVEVLRAALGNENPLNFQTHPAGADCYQQTGEAFPATTMDACKRADAVLHGAAGLPDVRYPDGTEAGQDFSLMIRPALDLYANVRPVRLLEGVRSPLVGRNGGDIDYVIVREGTEGMYAARGGGNVLGGRVATDTLVVTREGIERVVRFAAGLARRRAGALEDGKRRVTVVDKANVLRSYAFFRQVADEVLAEYPDIEAEHMIVDAMTVHMIERPEHFDVVVTENLFGDILSDLGAATVGGMGMSVAAELGDDHGYFQSSHGSAPDIAGRGVANPVATILSGAEMLDWLGQRGGLTELQAVAERIRKAVGSVVREGTATTPDIGGPAGTAQCTAAVIESLRGAQ